MSKLSTKLYDVFFSVVIEPMIDRAIKKIEEAQYMDRLRESLYQEWFYSNKNQSVSELYAKLRKRSKESRDPFDKSYAEFERSFWANTKDQ